MERIRYTLAGLLLSAGSTLFAQGENCAQAWALTGTGTYFADGPSTGDPGPGTCGAAGTHTDWYVYTPNFTGTVQLSSCDSLNFTFGAFSGVDTYVGVYSGSCGSLTCVGFNDDAGGAACSFGGGMIYGFSSFLEFPVVAGQPYFIVWNNTFSPSGFYWHLNECFAAVQGVTYLDANGNGVRDAGEGQVDAMLAQNPGGLYHYSGSDPYTFCSDSGAFTLTVPNPPLYHTVAPASQSYTATTLGTLVTGMDFGFTPQPGHYDGQCDIWGWAPWIGNNTNYHINCSNVGTEALNGNVVLTLDPLTSFVDAVPAPTSVVGQTVTWAVSAMAPGDDVHINVTYHTDSTALTTDQVTAMVVFNVDQAEETPADNTDDLTANPTTSFDPNDKAVSAQWITLDEIAESRALEYTIRFQNTGEMPAVNVVLRDGIDMDLDLSTFEMVGSTHENQISINGRELVFTFPQIMLPDSASDPAGSIGAVHFRLRPVASSVPGTLFENTAGIYFDYNEPVITNTVATEVASPESVFEAARAEGFVIYPNPGNGTMNLLWGSASTSDARLEVLDAMGRAVHSMNAQHMTEGQSLALDLNHLADGGYVVRVINADVNLTSRLTIRH